VREAGLPSLQYVEGTSFPRHTGVVKNKKSTGSLELPLRLFIAAWSDSYSMDPEDMQAGRLQAKGGEKLGRSWDDAVERKFLGKKMLDPEQGKPVLTQGRCGERYV